MWPWQRTVEADEHVRLEVHGVGSFETVVLRAVAGAAELGLVSGPVPARFLGGRSCAAHPTPDVAAGRIDGRLVASLDGHGRLRDDAVQMVFAVDLSAPSAAAATPPHAPVPHTAGGPNDRAAPAAAPPGLIGAAAYAAVRPHAPESQRRAFHRVPIERPVTLVPERFGAGWLDGRTHDLSAGGTLVSGAARLREGDRLRLVLELGPGTLFDTRGRITRIDEHGLAGVRWDHLSAAERERLAVYVARRQRAALARLRASA